MGEKRRAYAFKDCHRVLAPFDFKLWHPLVFIIKKNLTSTSWGAPRTFSKNFDPRDSSKLARKLFSRVFQNSKITKVNKDAKDNWAKITSP